MIGLMRVVIMALTFGLAACAGMTYAPVKFSNGIMTNSAGMALYTFDKDAAAPNKSACNGACAKNWPPFAAGINDKDGGDWSIIIREDGTRQWAYLGKPLYLWSKDQNPNDRTGDGFNGVWHIVVREHTITGAGDSGDGGR